MKLEEIFEVVKEQGIEQWDIGGPGGSLDFWGVMIDNKKIAKELKRMYRTDKKSLDLLYEKINAPLIVLEKYEGKPRLINLAYSDYDSKKVNIKDVDPEDLMAAKVYTLSKKRAVTFKKTNEYEAFAYKSFQKDINSPRHCCCIIHENECPVSYLYKK